MEKGETEKWRNGVVEFLSDVVMECLVLTLYYPEKRADDLIVRVW